MNRRPKNLSTLLKDLVVPEGFYRLKPPPVKSPWWPERRSRLKAILETPGMDPVTLVVRYRKEGDDDARTIDGIYKQVCLLVREGAKINGPIREVLHRLARRERELRHEATRGGSRLARAVESVQEQREADAKLPDSQENTRDVVLRALVKTWRAGNLSDGELLAALRGVGA